MIVLRLLVSLLIISSVYGLPTAFDIRYQPHIVPYGNFDSSSDYFCESYGWAKQLAQIVSNQVSVRSKQKIVLSAQQLAQCIPGENDKCKQTTLKNIQDAIDYVKNQGLIQEDCYRNRLFQLPSKYCARKCSNGQQFVRRFKVLIQPTSQHQQLLTSIGNGDNFGFAVYKYYEGMNEYNPSKPKLEATGEFYTYGIAQIVGWRNAGKQVTLRMASAGWGYKGYAYVPVNSPIIVKYYSVKMLGYHEVSVK